MTSCTKNTGAHNIYANENEWMFYTRRRLLWCPNHHKKKSKTIKNLIEEKIRNDLKIYSLTGRLLKLHGMGRE